MRRVVWPGPQPKSRARSVDEGSKLARNSRVGASNVRARMSSLRCALAESPNR